ncbi:hypothetical protein DFP72DRAFT_890351 [Ephemerocybe angulata]|uniref:Uncharacterized protein n=1 Tax=Ephemerocybe angulata TaxID=980116 RepID=A0A8H6MB38_9AGAR|nr:hypothetical protein DFP72DRAFT_890351 [Tulosesus angulatus]
MTSTSLAADPPSGWHSIRPWDAQLSLYVREITSVSVTFILATEISGPGESEVDPSLAALGFTAAAENEDSSRSTSVSKSNATSENIPNDDDEPFQQSGRQTSDSSSVEASTSASSSKKPRSLINEKLANGLRVNVNEVNWQRVFIRVDEKADEAVIIVYGLMPGRQYDIDLALVQPGQGQGQGQGQQQSLRRQILTFDDATDPDSISESLTDPDSYDHSNASSSDAHHTVSTPSTSPSRTIPNTPPPSSSDNGNTILSSSLSTASSSSSSSSDSMSSTSPPQISLEERLNQLRHSLSLINAEREGLSTSLKSARKESQKADAALRQEMEALKRASEKHTAGEVRSRQKILALQEAVKRAQAATKETESMVESMENEVPELLKRKENKESEYARVKVEAEKARRARETKVERDKKRQEGMRNELQSLTHKLEKLTAKKEKHETNTIPELEGQLGSVEKDIEEQEKILMQLEINREFEDVNRLVLSSQQQQAVGQSVGNPFALSPQYYGGFGEHHHANYVPMVRTRHQSLGTAQQQQQGAVGVTGLGGAGPGTIGRPSHLPVSVAPIQRPKYSASTSSNSLSLDLTTPAMAYAQQFQKLSSMPSGSASGSASASSSTSNIWSPPQVRHTPSGAGPGRSSSLQYPPPSQRYGSAELSSFYRDPPHLTSSSISNTHNNHHRSPQAGVIAPPPPMILTNPARRGSLKAGSSSKAPGSPSSLVSTSSSLLSSSSGQNVEGERARDSSPKGRRKNSRSSASAGQGNPIGRGELPPSPAVSSTLSGRAPAFEPGKRGMSGSGGPGEKRAPPGVIGAWRTRS